MADDLLLEPAVEELILGAPVRRDGEPQPSPSNFLFTGEDLLRVSSWNSKAGVTLKVQGRMWDLRHKRILPFGFDHTPNSDRTAKHEVKDIGQGLLLNLSVFADAGSPVMNQTFVRVQVVRGQNVAYVLGTLLQDHVANGHDLSFPGSPIRRMSEGPGVLRFVQGTNPAAGAEVAETVPTGARWQLQAFRAELATDGTVVNRRPRLQLADSSTFWLTIPAPGVIAASQSDQFYWTAGLAQDTVFDADAKIAGLPVPADLPAGHRILTATDNLQAGDNYSGPLFVVREWLEV